MNWTLDYEPLPAKESLRWAQQMLDRLEGLPSNLQDDRDGDCDDCSRPAARRHRVGRFVLCRSCAARRVATQVRETA